MRLHRLFVCLLALAGFTAPAIAEDGYDLWMRYRPLEPAAQTALQTDAQAVHLLSAETPTSLLAKRELAAGLSGLSGAEIAIQGAIADGAVVLANHASMPAAATQVPAPSSRNEGAFDIRTTTYAGKKITLISATSDIGLLYGSYALLRSVQQGMPISGIAVSEAPAVKLRMLNHWDNPDRHVERGYSGQSIFDWWRLPDIVDQRMTDYARANASIGINGAVVNNVNARAEMLSPAFIEKTAALADRFRPYGIRVYLSARFSAPRDLAGLPTADPLDPAVRKWWKAKADEIYRRIPDFGGFLVKANSEGQPGPQDYGRNHADGANMMAEAVGDRGVILWRAFVYAADNKEDRAKQAYSEFKPLDGKFAKNVIVQVKNGAIDFQPREPIHPLFGAMPETPLAMEFQITKEYLGFSTHLAYLAPLYEEVLDTDSFAKGAGSTVAKIVDGSLHGHRLSAIAGVANIGSDRNWSGSHFDQANWYAFGRLAWNPQLGSADIAREWAAMTFSRDPKFLAKAVPMMMGSRQAVVDYMTPLGLAHLMATGHHYGPAPWVSDLARPEWNPYYYHKADKDGIGFDRTASGSDAVSQYAVPLAQRYSNIATTGDDFLLWFHRLPWTHKMASGRPLWNEMVYRYDDGVAEVAAMQRDWSALEAYVDPQRFGDVRDYLAVQHKEAKWWRDASIAYWMSRNRLPLPPGAAAPPHSLDHYQRISFPNAPGN